MMQFIVRIEGAREFVFEEDELSEATKLCILRDAIEILKKLDKDTNVLELFLNREENKDDVR